VEEARRKRARREQGQWNGNTDGEEEEGGDGSERA